MGEYAKYGNDRIKIGTCEDMLYLRFTQRRMVTPEPNSIDPNNPKEITQIRFRFPFPDEDGIEPGAFADPDRGLAVPGYTLPRGENYRHGKRQFCTDGYNVSLPCPESEAGDVFSQTYPFHRNGWQGAVSIVQHRFLDGNLWTIARCNGCGAKFRLPWEEAEKMIVCLRQKADHHCMQNEMERARYWNQIAERIAIGYKEANPEQPA